MTTTIDGLTVSERTVFVLGAGFTHAFLPDAPLLTDNYDTDRLLKIFTDLRFAHDLLELELKRSPDRKINIERLMTRLDGQMPYDSSRGASEQAALLLRELKQVFRKRIENSKRGDYLGEDLRFFASFCIEHGARIVTFNYDDLLDEALWKVKGVRRAPVSDNKYWHPDGGYGFFCKPAESCIRDQTVFMDRTVVPVYKLHGSINWWPKLGSAQPYTIDAIVHLEQWYLPDGRYGDPDDDLSAIRLHLEPEPFTVPPVLVKSSLVREPILRLVWSQAYQALLSADAVFFIGYSLPPTDLAARFLFTEALHSLATTLVRVVNLARNEPEKEATRSAYRDVLPGIDDGQFYFGGAVEWIRQLRKAHGKP